MGDNTNTGMKTHLFKARIRSVMIELDNGTRFVVDPKYKRVQTQRVTPAGFVIEFSEVSMEQFLADAQHIMEDM